jgi:hypothetical protein
VLRLYRLAVSLLLSVAGFGLCTAEEAQSAFGQRAAARTSAHLVGSLVRSGYRGNGARARLDSGLLGVGWRRQILLERRGSRTKKGLPVSTLPHPTALGGLLYCPGPLAMRDSAASRLSRTGRTSRQSRQRFLAL